MNTQSRFILTAALFSVLVYLISLAGLTPVEPLYTALIIVSASAFIAYVTGPVQP